MTRASSKDHTGEDAVQTKVVQDTRALSWSDSRRRITTKRGQRGVRNEQSGTTERHVPRRISEKTAPQEHAVAVTTQEALDGYAELGVDFVGRSTRHDALRLQREVGTG